MAKAELTVDQLVPRLAATPPRIAALTDGLAPALLRTRPAPDEWSANEVLAHLRACADMWGGCIASMIAEDHPTLRAVNPTTWIGQTDYPDLAFQPSARLRHAARRSRRGPGGVAAGRLVACGDRDGGGEGARADRAALRAVDSEA